MHRTAKRRRGTHHAVALGAAMALAGSLAGCAAGPNEPTHAASSAVPTPMFASDEAVLAAATDAYAAYLKMSDTIAHEGGADPERIKPYVTAEWAKKEIAAFEAFHSKGLRQEGESGFSDERLQARTASSVILYACSDSGGTQFFNAAGERVTAADRVTHTSLVVEFDVSHKEPVTLAISKSEPWSGQSFC